MSKLFSLLLLVVGAVVLVPSLRARAIPHVQPAIDPFYEWSARNRVNEIVGLLHQESTLGRPIPASRDLPGFLERHDYKKDAGNDPWGTPFYIRSTRTTYTVGSAGRDRSVNTTDDILSAPQPRKGSSRR